jgi:glutamate dehydrogenase
MKVKKLLENLSSRVKDASLMSYIKAFYSYLPIDYLEIFSDEDFELFASHSYQFIKNYKESRIIKYEYIDIPKERTLFHIVGPNRPFIVDSLKNLFFEHKITFEFFLHPVGEIQSNHENYVILNKEKHSQSIICISVDGHIYEAKAKELTNSMFEMFSQVDLTHSSWDKMLNLIDDSKDLIINYKNSDKNDLTEFLDWLKSDNFTFLGCIDYDIKTSYITTKSGDQKIWGGDSSIKDLLDLIDINHSNSQIEFGKLTKLSNIHRNNFIDYILVKKFDDCNTLIGCRFFLGLYGSNLDYQSVKDIPIVRNKLIYVLEKSSFTPRGYNSKKLKIIIESLPRVALFHIDKEELYEICMKTLSGMSVYSLKLFRLGECKNNFVELITFLRRDKFTPEIHHKIHDYLKNKFSVEIIRDYTKEIGENFIFLYSTFVSEKCDKLPNNSTKAIEKELERITYMWEEELISQINAEFDNKKAQNIISKYSSIFPSDYQYNHSSQEALSDICNIDNLNVNKQVIFEIKESL